MSSVLTVGIVLHLLCLVALFALKALGAGLALYGLQGYVIQFLLFLRGDVEVDKLQTARRACYLGFGLILLCYVRL